MCFRVFKFLVKSVGENRHESEKTDEAKPSTSENDHSELDNYNLQPSKAEQSLDSDQLQFSLQDCLIESLGICLNLTNDSGRFLLVILAVSAPLSAVIVN